MRGRECLAGFVVLTTLTASAALCAGADELPRVPPTEPARAVATFTSQAGFRMELLAAEPLVTDPVAMAYDEDGRAYVCEMNDYPYTDARAHQAWKENTTDEAIGKVRLLIDENGDGVFDKSTVFVDKLSWPTGVACYKGGVYVCATPDVWYFKDTDNDGVADVKRKVFTGFRKFNVQAVMNNLIWGLDNRLYGAGGSNGGNIRPGDDPAARPVTFTRSDFRFDPATERFEPIPGGARFGNTFDDWGNRFICNIRNPAQHVVIESSHYLTRNPHAVVPSVVHDVAASGDALPVYRVSPLEAWRDVRANRLKSERSTQPRSELVAGGVVTSASGVTIYRGDAYPPEFRNQLFLGEVANNVIHRQSLAPDGATFRSKRIDEKVEFVASSDVWFRPVNFVNAPDGTLHVLDMYREVIEHPWSIPDDIRAKLDLRSGADRGRIYRLAPKGFKAQKVPRLGSATVAELVETLGSPNAWHRETAQRLLVERQEKSAVEPLRKLLAESERPLARLHALWTLEALSAAREADMLQALRDAHPGVRENAVRVAERHLKDSPALLEQVLHHGNDEERVRFQAALTLGGSEDPRVTDWLAQSAEYYLYVNEDPWLLAAILSASADRCDQLLVRLARENLGDSPFWRDALRRFAFVVGARNKPGELANVVADLPKSAVPAMSVVRGLGEGLRRHHNTPRSAVPGKPISDLLAEAARLAADPKAPPADRVVAIGLLAFDDFEPAKKVWGDLLDPRHPPEVQQAAVAALGGIGHPEVGPLLIARWRSYTPALRAQVMQAMLGHDNRLHTLFDAIEAGRVAARDVPASRRPALLKHSIPKTRERAEKLFGAEVQRDSRKAVLDRFAPALQLEGNARAGRAVYDTACASCHKIDAHGQSDVGPNLATVRQWGAEQLLSNILDPNREVAPAFDEYLVQLDTGETLSGVIASETASSVTLKMTGGAERVLSRQSIKRMAASGVSLMPEGLEEGITPQQMADLIAFLRAAPASADQAPR